MAQWITAPCRRCQRLVRVPLRDFVVEVSTVVTSLCRYRFLCPACGRISRTPLTRQDLQRLGPVWTSIVKENVPIPDEVFETHLGGTVDEDDLIQFCRSLYAEDADIAGRASTEDKGTTTNPDPPSATKRHIPVKFRSPSSTQEEDRHGP